MSPQTYVTCPRCQQQNYPNATQCAYCGTPLSPSMIGASPQAPGFSTGTPGFAPGPTTGAGQGGVVSGGTTQPQVGQLIDRKYRVERVLGEGGMGVVYVALDVNSDQKVVIKSIRPEFANRGDFRERTIGEGRALAKIDHQNVVRFYSIINSPETNELYIVMQFIDGESLDVTLEKANAVGQKLPITEVIRVFKQILDGVGAAHKEGLIHRDLKPANVLVRAKDGVAKVMDFGIAKTEGAAKGPTQAGGIVGSLFYMAPEQIKGARDLDKRLDVYALGIVLYELVTGKVPFDGDTEYDIMSKHMSDAVPSVKAMRPDAPDWIDVVIQRATAKDRTQRFSTCDEFRAMIDQYDGGIVVPRSSTAFEQSVLPEHSGSMPGTGIRPAAGSGTVVAGPMATPGTPPGMGAVNASSGGASIPDFRASHPDGGTQKKGGSAGLIIGIVAVLAIGGGAGWYFLAGPGSNSGTPDKKGAKQETKEPKGKEPANTKPTETNKKPPPEKKDPLKALIGTWKAEGTGRVLKAEQDGEEVDFKVVDPDQFGGAYSSDEVRFSLQKGDDDKSYYVIDRYRPNPQGKKYSIDALASCMNEFKEDEKKERLEAELKSDSTLEVSFEVATVGFKFGGDGSIASCTAPKLENPTKSVFKKQD
jgi:serine/threonine-protein kinase